MLLKWFIKIVSFSAFVAIVDCLLVPFLMSQSSTIAVIIAWIVIILTGCLFCFFVDSVIKNWNK